MSIVASEPAFSVVPAEPLNELDTEPAGVMLVEPVVADPAPVVLLDGPPVAPVPEEPLVLLEGPPEFPEIV